MMRLLCNGVALDLYENTDVQFKHENPLFAFDDLKCDRTTTLKLPSTPKNDRAFALARIPAYNGEAMRRKFSAQLQAGLVVKNGYLYITKYDGKDYQGVFVTGEFVGLQAVKDAGKLPELVHDETMGYASVDTGAYKNAFDYNWEQIKYRQASSDPSAPSVSAAKIIQAICSDFGLSVNLPSITNRLAIVPPYARTMQEETVVFDNTGYNVLPVLNDEPIDLSNELATGLSLLEQQDLVFYTYVKDNVGFVQQIWEYKTQVLVARQNLALSFPNTFPTDMFLIKITDASAQGMSGVEFLGDYAFEKSSIVAGESVSTTTGACVTTNNCTITGEPLRGRSVSVQNGDVLLFVTPYDYVNGAAIEEPFWAKSGWAFHQRTWTAAIKVQGAEKKATVGETIRLKDNVPDIDFTTLLKCVAAIDGKVLNFEDGTILFEDLDTSAYAIEDAQKIIGRKDVERTFGKFAQRNVVKYKQDEITPAFYIYAETYTVDNENIEEEKTLLELPFSPASEIAENGQIRAYLDNEYEEAKEFALMQLTGTGGDEYMHRVPLTKCAGLQVLCDASTQIKCTLRMNIQEYERVHTKTVLRLDGTKYLWTDRNWKSETADFTLAKIE